MWPGFRFVKHKIYVNIPVTVVSPIYRAIQSSLSNGLHKILEIFLALHVSEKPGDIAQTSKMYDMCQ